MSDLQKTLSEIQKKLVAPKNQLNKFGGYNYRSCEDILEALKKVLPEGAYVTISDDIVMVGERVYVKAAARFHFNNEFIETVSFAREPLEKRGSDASQITGAASSYARKYALNGLFLIDDNKDADHTNEHDKGEKKQPQQQKSKIPSVKEMTNIVIGLVSDDAKLDAHEYWGGLSKDAKRGIWPNLNKEQQEWIIIVMKNAPKD